VAVGLEHGAAEGADDGAPGAAVHGEQVADPGGGLHVRHARAPAAPRADPRRRLAAPHRPPLVHQEAEEHHPFPPSLPSLIPFGFLHGSLGCPTKLISSRAARAYIAAAAMQSALTRLL